MHSYYGRPISASFASVRDARGFESSLTLHALTLLLGRQHWTTGKGNKYTPSLPSIWSFWIVFPTCRSHHTRWGKGEEIQLPRCLSWPKSLQCYYHCHAHWDNDRLQESDQGHSAWWKSACVSHLVYKECVCGIDSDRVVFGKCVLLHVLILIW